MAQDCDLDRKLLSLIFVNLKVQIETRYQNPSRDPPLIDDKVNITIYRPVSSECFFNYLLKIPMRHSLNAKSWLGVPRYIGTVALVQGGYLYLDTKLVSAASGIISPLLYLPTSRGEHVALLRQRETRSSLSSSALFEEGVLAEHVASSFLELLKAAGWSHKAVFKEPIGRHDEEYIRGLPPTPHIAVKLSTNQLSPLLQRVSRR
jgi:hypothetical protein